VLLRDDILALHGRRFPNPALSLWRMTVPGAADGLIVAASDWMPLDRIAVLNPKAVWWFLSDTHVRGLAFYRRMSRQEITDGVGKHLERSRVGARLFGNH
jgi:hypothetical protein